MSDPTSVDDATPDKDLDQQLRQLLLDQQSAATAFDQIWLRAQTRANQAQERPSLFQNLRQNSRVTWAGAAVAAVVMLTFGIINFNSESVFTNYEPVLLSKRVAPNDELFVALISSSHWSAPSDQFLKNQPQLNIWGLPAITIPPPSSIEEVI
jgi:hypothetical protein